MVEKNVLLVVDYQWDFVVGTLGSKAALALYIEILNRVNKAIERGDIVIFTKDTHYKGDSKHIDYLDTQEGRKLPIEHCIKGTKGHTLYGDLQKVAEESGAIIIEKNTFPSLELANILLELSKKVKIVKVEVCGVDTCICVISNGVIVKAALPEVEITILKKLCASSTPENQQLALSIFPILQMNVE